MKAPVGRKSIYSFLDNLVQRLATSEQNRVSIHIPKPGRRQYDEVVFSAEGIAEKLHTNDQTPRKPASKNKTLAFEKSGLNG